MNNQVYKKVGRKYMPIGYSDGWNGFPSDGIWLVQSKDGGTSSECIIKYEDLETAKPAVNLILGYKDKILDYISKNKNNINVSNTTINDFVLDMLKEISK